MQDFVIPDLVYQTILHWLSALNCILPVTSLLPIVGMSIAMTLFRIIWSVLLRIKSFIPTIGGY